MLRPLVLVVLLLGAPLLAGCMNGPDEPAGDDADGNEPTSSRSSPYVIVGVPDTGIDPYHVAFHRPNLTAHPCTYLADFPCSVQALNLSIGVHSRWEDAFEADRDVWAGIEEGVWYWIPRTPFIAVTSEMTDEDVGDGVRLRDTTGTGHGTGVVSLVLRENPDALIAFLQFTIPTDPTAVVAERDMFVEDGIPVDILSASMATWQVGLPVPAHEACDQAHHFFRSSVKPFVKAAGNAAGSSLHDCWNGDPATIVVGGAYPHDRSSEGTAHREPDVVSYFCPPYAVDGTLDQYAEGGYCGTSFATPMVSGALSRVVLEVRRASDHHGGRSGHVLDPVSGLTVAMLRDAMNLTASYAPEPRFEDGEYLGTRVPVDEERPWLQWGWGFYDALVANATIAQLLGQSEPAEKPDEAVLYMETQHEVRRALYGERQGPLPTQARPGHEGPFPTPDPS